MSRALLALSGIALIALQASPALAAPRAASTAASTMRIDRARIDRALSEMVASGRAAGVSALITKDGREAYFGSSGHADREASRPMTRSTMVQIYSMTKPVTGVALMQLWEQGRFGLDDKLSDHLPEFANVKVFGGMDSAGQPILKDPARPILVRDVFRHTAGFGYGPADSFPGTQWAALDPLALDHDLAEFGRRLAKVPLMFEPGSQWGYSAAVDVQALLVEKLSGMPFETYVGKYVIEPLGMNETGWTQPEARFPRLAAVYVKGPEGTLQRQPDEATRRANFSDRKLIMGGSGLASTLDDYTKFAQMLLNGRTGNGVRILKPSTVKLMATDQLDARVTERQWLGSKGSGGFGFNFFVRTSQPKTPEEHRGAVGEYFWDGAASTLFWVDPANRLTAVFFVQTMPFDGTLHRDFRKAVYGESYLGPKGD